ncbi:MAG: PKD domain-containing protein [Phycisphaerae bacterium]
MMSRCRTNLTPGLTLALLCTALCVSSCQTDSGILPTTGQIKATLKVESPAFTVELSIADAVTDAASISDVNWVFGDGPGFTTGNVTIQHRYLALGTYNVTAYVFRSGSLTQTLTGTVTVQASPKASNPTPAKDATGVAITQVLSWTSGSGATGRNVYLGTDMAAVDAATSSSAEFKGMITVTHFTPAELLPGTPYFWRIDEIAGGTTTKGDVWAFTTANAPGAISNLVPDNNAFNVPTSQPLSWTAGSDATSHDVYFGTDGGAVDSADTTSAEFKGNQSTTSFNPGALDPATNYFWRVDEKGPGGVLKGALNTFSTAPLPGQSNGQNPADNDTGVDVDIVLSWAAGADATSHDVYFGASSAAVDAATHASPEFRGNQATLGFDPGPSLPPNTERFWRIDEVGPGGTTKGDVFSFTTAEAPTDATDPSPANNDQGVSTGVMPSWTAGTGATSHDVYLGTSQTAVTNATKSSAEFKGNQPGTTFTPAAALLDDTNYFWRIDEVGPGGTNKGDVLTFRTANPSQASNPTPTHNATGVPLNQVLSWSPGSGATSNDVYFGTSQSAVTNATTASAEFQGNFPQSNFTPPALTGGTTYFWRVDSVGVSTVKGLIWKFTAVVVAPGQASNPSPGSGVMDVSLSAQLSWTAGTGATSHDVYFGTSQTDVTNATTANPLGVFRGNRPTATYNPGALANATTYFWRIDEKNSAGTTPGSVFSFTTVANAPAVASMFSPADMAVNQNINTPNPPNSLSLSWSAGAGATSHDVYFSTDQAAVTTGGHGSGSFKNNQAGTTFNPGALAANTTYFWRVDEVNAGGTTAGTVMRFTTAVAPSAVNAPTSPTAGEQGVSNMPTLSWPAASSAATYDVYFGTSSSAVDMAIRQPPSAEFRGNQAGTSFAPAGMLMADTVYFWRIDAIGPGGLVKGQVFSFRTAP